MNPGKVAVSILCAAAAVAAIGAMRTTAAARTAAAVALARAEDTRRRDADVAFFVRRVAADPMGVGGPPNQQEEAGTRHRRNLAL